jgi:peptidoglycan/LPS O-acetylase OafA/YrhL
MATISPESPRTDVGRIVPAPQRVETTSPAVKERRPASIDSLTSLRGLAALWVVVLHFNDDLGRLLPGLRAFDSLIVVGYLAVPYFFVLSGFVLAYNYAAEFRHVSLPSYVSFMRRRWLRIYPVHFVTLLGVLAMVLVSSHLGVTINRQDKFSAFDFVLNLFLVQTWVPHYTLNWNNPAWSISSEWFAYLLFPLLCVGLNRLSSTRLAGLAIVGWLVSVGFFVWGIGMPFSELVEVAPTFVTGCAIALYLSRRTGVTALPRFVPDLLVMAIVCTPLMLAAGPGEGNTWKSQLVIALLVTFFVATIYCFGSLGNSCSRLWRSRPLIYLGEVSYSLYMTHALVLMAMPKLLPSVRYADSSLRVRLLVVAAYVALVAGATLATYYLVENPARKHLWKRRAARNILSEPPA